MDALRDISMADAMGLAVVGTAATLVIAWPVWLVYAARYRYGLVRGAFLTTWIYCRTDDVQTTIENRLKDEDFRVADLGEGLLVSNRGEYVDLELGVVEIHSLRDMRFSIRAKLRQVGSNVSVSYGLSEQPYVKVDERLREELDEYLRLLFVEKPDAEVEPATSYCDVIDHYKCAWLMQLPWAAAIIVLPLGVTWAAGSLLVTVILALLAPTTIRIARRRPVRSVVPRDFYVEGAKRLAFTAAVATAAFVWRYVV